MPTQESQRVREILDEACRAPSWCHSLSDDRELVQVVLEAEGSEDLLDVPEREMESDESFRMLLLPVEASIPRSDSGSDEDGDGGQAAGGRGILGDDTLVVIGAMVIAPLMGPDVALAVATTLADWELGSRAVKAGVVGTMPAVAISAT